MGTTTSRFGLHKPDDADLARDFPSGLRPDLDVIDSALGMFPCTSGTRPASPQNGRMIRETDTGKAYFWDGTAWKQIYVEGAATAALTVAGVTSSEDIDVAAGKQVNVGASLSSATFAAKLAGSGDLLAAVRFGTDTVDRLVVKADGKLEWGPGNGAVDANLYRNSFAHLKTDSNLIVDKVLTVNEDISVGRHIYLGDGMSIIYDFGQFFYTDTYLDIIRDVGGVAINTGHPIVGAVSNTSSPRLGTDGNGPYIRLFWTGTNVQFVRTDTNAVVKTFVIDHPTDVDRYLVHATTESPHNGVEYWGVITVQDGVAEVVLPDYVEALCRVKGRAVLLTPVAPDDTRKRPSRKGAKKRNDNGEAVLRHQIMKDGLPTGEVRDEIVPAPAPAERDDLVPQVAATYLRDGRFRIIADHGCPETFEVSWLVKAIRKDVAELDPEPLKSDNDLFGDGPYTYLRKKGSPSS